MADFVFQMLPMKMYSTSQLQQMQKDDEVKDLDYLGRLIR